MPATAKSEAEIIAAHKRTLEVCTGKICTIVLVSKEDFLLKGKPLQEIFFAVEKFNTSSYSILSDRGAADYKKIFCLIADKAGHSAKKIGAYLSNKDHTGALYNIRTGKALLKTDTDFKSLYHTVIKTIINGR